MYQKFHILREIHRRKSLFYALAILTLQIFSCQTAIASTANQGYTPPVDPQSTSTQNRQSSGSRGCESTEASISLKLLKPQDSKLLPSNNPPLVVFNISAVPKDAVIVSLTQPDKIDPTFVREITIVRPGIWTVVANPEINLVEDQDYVLTVLVPCNSYDISQNIHVRSLYRKSN